MSDGNQDDAHEIILVRRRKDIDEDEHHGGVWKVAFADFMTAMMAFFLVLWIVNSTTKETRNSLARYFNPVRLSDTTPARRGLQDPGEGDFDATNAPADSKKGGAAALAPQAAKAEAPPAERATPDRIQFRDPFAGADRARPRAAETESATQGKRSGADRGDEARTIMNELRRRLGAEASAQVGDALAVERDPDGVLISLTDGSDFGMFAVGSASPQPLLVRALGAIAQTLAAHEGEIVVRGHTDGRPYRGDEQDNWRLSTFRAWQAYRILANAGLPDMRVTRIEGYADHRLKRADDPAAPANRRIEVLLRPKP